jgi:hypothetical protein
MLGKSQFKAGGICLLKTKGDSSTSGLKRDDDFFCRIWNFSVNDLAPLASDIDMPAFSGMLFECC